MTRREARPVEPVARLAQRSRWVVCSRRLPSGRECGARLGWLDPEEGVRLLGEGGWISERDANGPLVRLSRHAQRQLDSGYPPRSRRDFTGARWVEQATVFELWDKERVQCPRCKGVVIVDPVAIVRKIEYTPD